MKKLLISFCLILFGMVIVYGVHADDKETVTSLKYVNDVLATKQDEIGAQSGTMAVTYTNTPGTVTPREVKSNLGTSTSDTSLPMVGGVNTKLATKQDEIPAKNTNTVLTYTGVAGTVGEKGIYQDTGTYAAQSDNLIDAGTFNAALKNGLDNEFVCAGYATTGECWLWTIHNDGESINLFNKDEEWTHGWYISSSNTLADAANANRTAVIPCLPNTTYYFKHTSNTGGGRMFYCESEEYDVGSTSCSSMVGRTNLPANQVVSITTSADAKWLFVAFGRRDSSVTSSFESQAEDAMLSTTVLTESTPYEPYENIYIPQNQ